MPAMLRLCAAVAAAVALGAVSASGEEADAVLVKGDPSGPADTPDCSYFIMLYDDSVLPGSLVLGQSLTDAGSIVPRHAMVTNDVSKSTQAHLKANGWTVLNVGATRPNPNGKHHKYYQSRLAGAYTKLDIYSMTNVAKRLVYLDTDTQVTENIDDLCMCQGECGVVRSGFVNTGVLVVEPNLELYEEMLKQVDLIPSYNGGEQGFTNSFFAGFEGCPMFYGKKDPCLKDSPPDYCNAQFKVGPAGLEIKCHRLASYMNGDVGFHLLHNAWLFPKDNQQEEMRTEPALIHHTLAIFKPWKWWSYHVMTSGWLWRAVYVRTPLYNPMRDLMLGLFISALPALLWVYFRRRWQPTMGAVAPSKTVVAAEQPSALRSMCRPLERIPSWVRRSLYPHLWLMCTLPLSWAWMKITVGDYPMHPYIATAAVTITHTVLVDLVWLHGNVGSALSPEARRLVRLACPTTTLLFNFVFLFANATVFKKAAFLILYMVGYVGGMWSYLCWGTMTSHPAAVNRARASSTV